MSIKALKVVGATPFEKAQPKLQKLKAQRHEFQEQLDDLTGKTGEQVTKKRKTLKEKMAALTKQILAIEKL